MKAGLKRLMNYNISIIFTDRSDEEQKDTGLFRRYVSRWTNAPQITNNA